MWLSSLNIYEENHFCEIKKKNTWNIKNENHFSRRLNVQVCELLQVLTEVDIIKKWVLWITSALGIVKHNKL